MTMESASAKPEAAARLAATMLLLREGPSGMEIFMVVRHHEIDFASGALVFPGGSVDEGDRDIASNLALLPIIKALILPRWRCELPWCARRSRSAAFCWRVHAAVARW